MSLRYFDHDQGRKDKDTSVFVVGANEIEQSQRRRRGRQNRSEQSSPQSEKNKSFTNDSRKQAKRTNGRAINKKGKDPYPGPAPIDESLLEKHTRGEGVDVKRIKSRYRQQEFEKREKQLKNSEELAARTELLLDNDHKGFIEADQVIHEFTGQITQTEIKNAIEDKIEVATKAFELDLRQFGPYKVDYTRNGRHLLLGGRVGHVAAFDWVAKKLLCEINVQESVHDVKWLHTENLFAVAQKKWTYVYDNQGIELHCLKVMDHVSKLEFLPYHFLLASASDRGFLSWIDISTGELISQFNALQGPLSVLSQNMSNAILITGHAKGTVSMWSPNVKEPVAKMLVHRQPVRAVTVDLSGNYMATAGADRCLRIWDIRQYKCLQDYRMPTGISELKFSDTGLLAAALDTCVHVFKDCCLTTVDKAYLRHEVHEHVSSIKFAPYEDVLGIGHTTGFQSILVPGSGENNFDALESNPLRSKKQRREWEVKALLEKVPADLISLDENKLGDVDVDALQKEMEEKRFQLHLKPNNLDFEPRKRKRGKSNAARRQSIKSKLIEEEKARQRKALVEGERREGMTRQERKPKSIIDRFK